MTTISCEDTTSLSNSDKVLLGSILEYYNDNKNHTDNFIGIVQRKNGMSLRVIDWLVTNYSKERSIVISTKDGHLPRDLNRDYQKNLNAYNKKAMDPFSRRNKIKLTICRPDREDEYRQTSIGQLNFFRWFFKNSVDLYLLKEKRNIELHMKKTECDNKKNKQKKKVVFCAPKAYIGKFTMSFD